MYYCSAIIIYLSGLYPFIFLKYMVINFENTLYNIFPTNTIWLHFEAAKYTIFLYPIPIGHIKFSKNSS